MAHEYMNLNTQIRKGFSLRKEDRTSEAWTDGCGRDEAGVVSIQGDQSPLAVHLLGRLCTSIVKRDVTPLSVG